MFKRLGTLALEGGVPPQPAEPFQKIAEHVQYINDKKTTAMFAKVDLKVREGAASLG